jgi:hypothetical protein
MHKKQTHGNNHMKNAIIVIAIASNLFAVPSFAVEKCEPGNPNRREGCPRHSVEKCEPGNPNRREGCPRAN